MLKTQVLLGYMWRFQQDIITYPYTSLPLPHNDICAADRILETS